MVCVTKAAESWTQLHRDEKQVGLFVCCEPAVSEQTTASVCGQEEVRWCTNVMWQKQRSMCGQYGSQCVAQPLREDLLHAKLQQPGLFHLPVYRGTE